MRYRELRIQASRSIQLFARDFLPQSNDHGLCILIHGANEHGGRHQHVAERLCRQGWRVIVPDLRGHGMSGGRPMYISSFQQYVDDLATIHDHFTEYKDTTVHIGYSLGGLISVRHAQAFPGQTRAMCLTCPLLGLSVPVSRWLYMTGRLLSRTYPWKRFSSVLNPTDVTRCKISIAERKFDPLYRHGVTAGWFFAVNHAIQSAWSDAPSITSPLLLVQASEDRVVNADAGRSWLHRIHSEDVEFMPLPQQFHEWHYERSWANTTDIIAGWLASRLNPLPFPAIPMALSRAA